MRRAPALWATLCYLVVGACWVVFSDAVALRMAEWNPELTADRIQLYKGLLYVLLTGVLVFLLVSRAINASRRAAARLDKEVRERTVALNAARRDLQRLNSELRRRNRELERTNRDLNSFSHSISHDLRTPVRSIEGFADIIRRRYATAMPGEGRHYLDNIIASARLMNRLIDGLLRFVRLGFDDAGRTSVSLLEIVQQVARQYEPDLQNAGATIEVPENDVNALGSPVLVAQIVSNLVENAIKYGDATRRTEIRVTLERRNGRAVLGVVDNGVGISEEQREPAFELFRRLQHRESEGTGMGLAIARRAAERMDGELTVHSVPTGGSEFVLDLPEAEDG